jgi:hypothetical protein
MAATLPVTTRPRIEKSDILTLLRERSARG